MPEKHDAETSGAAHTAGPEPRGTSESVARSADLMGAARSALIVIDVQERLMPVIPDAPQIIGAVRLLLDAAQRTGVPCVVSEQYPRGLGRTVESLSEHPAVEHCLEKMSFSAAPKIQPLFADSVCLPESSGVPEFPQLPGNVAKNTAPDSVSDPKRDQMIVCGVESHICVLQTSLDLLAMGYRVAVVADAIGSRRVADHQVALTRMRDAGCTVLTSESVVFEWCEAAGTDLFREISRLIKQRS